MNIRLTEQECLKNSSDDVMAMFKRLIAFIMTVLLAIPVAGCVDRFPVEETSFSTGEILTPEMIESIFDAISVSVTEKYPTETIEDGTLIVYWLSGGSVWHASIKCGSVAKASAENLHYGSIEEAVTDGKSRGCKICASGIDYTAQTQYDSVEITVADDVTEPEKYPRIYDDDGNLIVFWVKNGSVWHESSTCSSLSKTSDADIVSGTEVEARAAGKERACKKCTKNN